MTPPNAFLIICTLAFSLSACGPKQPITEPATEQESHREKILLMFYQLQTESSAKQMAAIGLLVKAGRTAEIEEIVRSNYEVLKAQEKALEELYGRKFEYFHKYLDKDGEYSFEKIKAFDPDKKDQPLTEPTEQADPNPRPRLTPGRIIRRSESPVSDPQ